MQPMQKSLSLGFAIQRQKAGYTSPMDTSPYAQVATPSRAAAGACRTPGSWVGGNPPPACHNNFLSPTSPGMAVGSPNSGRSAGGLSMTSSKSLGHLGMGGGGAAMPPVTPIASPHHQMGERKQGSTKSGTAAVSVIAPGGGTGINGAVYAQLGQDPAYAVDIVGRSRAPYDCYPEFWPNGGPAPNLATFAEDVMRQGWVEKSDCFVFGSRGGQVVLPILWDRKREQMPPVVCINGGCSMGLPRPIHWPDTAVSFLLMGGQDYFRGNATIEQYIEDSKGRVPKGNSTTAILFVNEMQHMPQAALLKAVLPLMLKTILRWKKDPERPPREVFRAILEKVNSAGWSGRLTYTKGPGDWAPEVDFSPFHVTQHVETEEDIAARERESEAEASQPIQMSRAAELKELLRAAVHAAKPSGGVPLANPADRFLAAAQAAAKREVDPQPAQHHATTPTSPSPTSPQKLQLPQGSLGRPRSGGLSPAVPGGSNGLSLPIPQAGHSKHVGFASDTNFNASPGGTPKARNGPSPMTCATPISRALGMPMGGGMQFVSPVASPCTSPCPSNAGSMTGSACPSQTSVVSAMSQPPSPYSEVAAPIRPPIVVINR